MRGRSYDAGTVACDEHLRGHRRSRISRLPSLREPAGKGHRVVCLDNLDTGSLANIAHIRDDDFVFRNADITEQVEIDGPVDFVYHLASPASPIDYARLPLHTLKVGGNSPREPTATGPFRWPTRPPATRSMRRPPREPVTRGLMESKKPSREPTAASRGSVTRTGARRVPRLRASRRSSSSTCSERSSGVARRQPTEPAPGSPCGSIFGNTHRCLLHHQRVRACSSRRSGGAVSSAARIRSGSGGGRGSFPLSGSWSRRLILVAIVAPGRPLPTSLDQTRSSFTWQSCRCRWTSFDSRLPDRVRRRRSALAGLGYGQLLPPPPFVARRYSGIR